MQPTFKELAPFICIQLAKEVSGGKKPLNQYTMGYKLTIEHNGDKYTHDTRQYYSGKKKYTATHPAVTINLDETEYKRLSKIAAPQLIQEQQEQKRREKHNKQVEIDTKKYFENGGSLEQSGYAVIGSKKAITGIPERFINDKKFIEKLRKHTCSRGEQPQVVYLTWSLSRWYLSGVPIGEEYPSIYNNKLPHLFNQIEHNLELIYSKITGTKTEIEYVITNEKNIENRQKYIEKIGYDKIEPFMKKVDTGFDGQNLTHLFKLNELSVLKVRDTSTGKFYYILPPDQKTENANQALKSTFREDISIRQGDVGVSFVGEQNILSFQS